MGGMIQRSAFLDKDLLQQLERICEEDDRSLANCMRYLMKLGIYLRNRMQQVLKEGGPIT